ncbi:uncharacterized protein LOC144902203 isoform X2 [Branchiostoma floridae x Branchiostoma belcheri]
MASGKFRLRCVFLVVLLALLLTGGDGWRRRRRRRCSCPWGGWGAWSGCSSACGGGTQHRSRFRNACCSPSQETQTSTCNTHSCCSCTWRPWSYWSSCSRTCDGGTQHRARSRNSCCGYPNQQTQTNTCNTHSCCSCTWRPWGHWSSCSRTCGGGQQTRTRTRDYCCSPSHEEDTRHCHNQRCDDNTHGVPSPVTTWSTERLTLVILGVLLGIVITGILVWYCFIRDPNRVIDIRGRY